MEVVHKIGRRKNLLLEFTFQKVKETTQLMENHLNEYFPTDTLQYKVNQPFTLTETSGHLMLK